MRKIILYCRWDVFYVLRLSFDLFCTKVEGCPTCHWWSVCFIVGSSHPSWTDASSSCWAPLKHLPKMSSPSCSGRQEVSSWAVSPNPTATWLKPSVRLPTTLCQALTRPCAPSTSSLTLAGLTSQRWWDEGRCGRLPPPGSSIVSQPSSFFLCLSHKYRSKSFLHTELSSFILYHGHAMFLILIGGSLLIMIQKHRRAIMWLKLQQSLVHTYK